MTDTDSRPVAWVPLDALPHRDWPAAAAALERDGVVHLAGALDADRLGFVTNAVVWSLTHPSPNAVRWYPDEKATFSEDAGQHHLDLVRHTGIDTMVAALWGGVHDMWYLGEQLFLKDGGTCRRTPWHRDTSHLRTRGSQLVACWISLDSIPKRHCLEFVRGSHKGTDYHASAFASRDATNAPRNQPSPWPRLPDIEKLRGGPHILSWDIEPGDVVVFHLGVLYGGAGNEPGMRSRTMFIRFLGPDVVFERRSPDDTDPQEENVNAMALPGGAGPFHAMLPNKV